MRFRTFAPWVTPLFRFRWLTCYGSSYLRHYSHLCNDLPAVHIVPCGRVTSVYIARCWLYPFVTMLAHCRHLAGAVNWQCYSVLRHSIRLLVLVGYQPNDKERIVVPLMPISPLFAAHIIRAS